MSYAINDDLLERSRFNSEILWMVTFIKRFSNAQNGINLLRRNLAQKFVKYNRRFSGANEKGKRTDTALDANLFLQSFNRSSMGLQRYIQVKDMGAGDFGSVSLHRRSETPVTRSVQIQPQSITFNEEMRPSEILQQAEAAATARGGDTACGKGVRYGECRKNHAASVGGYAVDGCGEFMASGEEGTAEAMKCAACNCHRNFHRREAENETLCECHRIRR